MNKLLHKSAAQIKNKIFITAKRNMYG